jgi:hypothetical protein
VKRFTYRAILKWLGSLFSILVLCLFATWLEAAPLDGFPSEIPLEHLWQKAHFEGRESQAYRFSSAMSVDRVSAMLKVWLTGPLGAPQVKRQGQWLYLSQRRDGWWVTAQLRSLSDVANGTVEGLLTIWRHSSGGAGLPVKELTALSITKVIRQFDTEDGGIRSTSLTLLSEQSRSAVQQAFEADFKRLGMTPASYSPPALKTSSAAAQGVSTAWRGNGSQLVMTVFSHRGQTAVVIHWMGTLERERY